MPLSFGLAAATRIGNLVGEVEFEKAKYASHVAILICLSGAIANKHGSYLNIQGKPCHYLFL